MGVNSVKPGEALQELRYQENIINSLVETQVVLQLLVKHNIVTREEIASMRETVRNAPKYRHTIESIEQQKAMYEYALDNPEEYLKALMRSKLDN